MMGSFDVRRGNGRDTYRFSCAMNLTNGRVRGVDIFQGRGEGNADRFAGREGAASACQRAAERMERDGYRNVQFGRLDADNRSNDRIAGVATAQRGNNGRAYDFEISCSVDQGGRDVRSVQVKRR